MSALVRGVFRGGAMGAQPPLDVGNLWISGGFKAPKGAEPPRCKGKILSPHGKIPEYAPECCQLI